MDYDFDITLNRNKQGQTMLPHPANMFPSSHAAAKVIGRLYLVLASRRRFPDHRRAQG